MSSKKIRVSCGRCPMCFKDNYVDVFEEDYKKHLKNPQAKIIDLYPYLDANDRELMISGICSKCWDILFKEDM